MKRLVVILAIISSICAFCITTSAQSPDLMTDIQNQTDSLSLPNADSSDTMCMKADNADALTSVLEESNSPLTKDDPLSDDAQIQNVLPSDDVQTQDAPTDVPEDDANLFSMFYELMLRYAGEILSALAALASCLLALGYKKGLLPFLQQGLGVISGTVKNLGEKAESANRTVTEQSESTRIIAERMEEAVRALSESVKAVTERLALLEESREDGACIREVLMGEIDMLSEIFLASSLPEYRKERIGESVAQLKQRINPTKGE